jgi:DNA-binding MarR family transcriptional regulator
VSERAKPRRQKLTEALSAAAQRSATDAVMLHQAIADRIGLPTTDLRCLNIIRQSGHTTPGQLAAATGLTTGAITRMIDRLFAAGYLQRANDHQDRRRVIITAVPERMAELAPYYEPLGIEFHKVTSGYTNDQLALILGLFDRLHEASTRVKAQLRSSSPDASAPHLSAAAEPNPPIR